MSKIVNLLLGFLLSVGVFLTTNPSVSFSSTAFLGTPASATEVQVQSVQCLNRNASPLKNKHIRQTAVYRTDKYTLYGVLIKQGRFEYVGFAAKLPDGTEITEGSLSQALSTATGIPVQEVWRQLDEMKKVCPEFEGYPEKQELKDTLPEDLPGGNRGEFVLLNRIRVLS